MEARGWVQGVSRGEGGACGGGGGGRAPDTSALKVMVTSRAAAARSTSSSRASSRCRSLSSTAGSASGGVCVWGGGAQPRVGALAAQRKPACCVVSCCAHACAQARPLPTPPPRPALHASEQARTRLALLHRATVASGLAEHAVQRYCRVSQAHHAHRQRDLGGWMGGWGGGGGEGGHALRWRRGGELHAPHVAVPRLPPPLTRYLPWSLERCCMRATSPAMRGGPAPPPLARRNPPSCCCCCCCQLCLCAARATCRQAGGWGVQAVCRGAAHCTPLAAAVAPPPAARRSASAAARARAAAAAPAAMAWPRVCVAGHRLQRAAMPPHKPARCGGVASAWPLHESLHRVGVGLGGAARAMDAGDWER